MAAYKLCSLWKRGTFNPCRTGFSQLRRFESTNSIKTADLTPKSSWKFLILAFGFPVGGFLFYKTVVDFPHTSVAATVIHNQLQKWKWEEPSDEGLSEEEKKVPYITRFMIKYLMEDPIENKRKIHEHIKACRQVADKRLYLNHIKQNPIAPGKFREKIAEEKKNVAYDTDMY